MDIIQATRTYLEAIFSASSDMKVLVLDDDTTPIVGLVFSQTELLNHDIVLLQGINKLTQKKVDESLSSLSCICIIRPSQENIHLLCMELNEPHYETYSIFFTNQVKQSVLTNLALSDKKACVSSVCEIFTDVLALNRRLFSMSIPRSINLLEGRREDPLYNRISDQLLSVACLSKINPIIRFDACSQIAQQIARQFATTCDQNRDLFRESEPATVIILDRRSDPVTPLLHAWTYQSMICDYLDFQNNVVALCDGSKVVVDERTDEFFGENLFTNIGDLGQRQAELLQGAKRPAVDPSTISIDELKKYVRDYPELSQRQATAEKHTNILRDISKTVTEQKLMEIGPLEQLIVTRDDPEAHFSEASKWLQSVNITTENAMRLAMLMGIRYHNIDQLKELMPIDDCKKVDAMLQFANFDIDSIFPFKKNMLANIMTRLTESSNKFEQWVPLVSQMIQKIKNGGLDKSRFPFISREAETRKFIVFIVGGATYAEARIVYEEAHTQGGIDMILGGTTIHSARSFINQEVC